MVIHHIRAIYSSNVVHTTTTHCSRAMEAPDMDLRWCFKWSFKFIQFAGYWFPRNPTFLHKAYATMVICFTIFVYMCTEFAYLIFVFGQLEDMANGLFLLITHAAQTVKISIFIFKRQKIYALLDCLEDKLFKPRNMHQLKNTVQTIRNADNVGKIFIGLVIATVSLWSIFPLLENNSKKELPLRAWYPFNAMSSPKYEITYTYQIATVMLCGCANAAMDSIAAAFISQICAQLDILSDSILNIKEFAKLQVEKKANSPNLEVPFTAINVPQEIEKEMKSIFLECVNHHLKIMRCVCKMIATDLGK